MAGTCFQSVRKQASCQHSAGSRIFWFHHWSKKRLVVSHMTHSALNWSLSISLFLLFSLFLSFSWLSPSTLATREIEVPVMVFLMSYVGTCLARNRVCKWNCFLPSSRILLDGRFPSSRILLDGIEQEGFLPSVSFFEITYFELVSSRVVAVTCFTLCAS